MTKLQELREAIEKAIEASENCGYYREPLHRNEVVRRLTNARAAIAAIIDTPEGREGLRRELEGEAWKPVSEDPPLDSWYLVLGRSGRVTSEYWCARYGWTSLDAMWRPPPAGPVAGEGKG
jgi:hypothetical protein